MRQSKRTETAHHVKQLRAMLPARRTGQSAEGAEKPRRASAHAARLSTSVSAQPLPTAPRRASAQAGILRPASARARAQAPAPRRASTAWSRPASRIDRARVLGVISFRGEQASAAGARHSHRRAHPTRAAVRDPTARRPVLPRAGIFYALKYCVCTN